MNFINDLVEATNRKDVEESLAFGDYESMGLRAYEHLNCNNGVALSIQASFGHYCNPRKTLEDLTQYNSMELAIIKNGDFTSIDNVTDDIYLIDSLSEYYVGTVYSYVPVELLEELYQKLN